MREIDRERKRETERERDRKRETPGGKWTNHHLEENLSFCV